MTPVLIPHETVNDESVTVVAWRVADGQKVEQGQTLAEVEGSKTLFEITAPASGVVRYSIPVKGEVPVGAALCNILVDGESLPAAGAVTAKMTVPAPRAEERAAASAPVKAPVEVAAAVSGGNAEEPVERGTRLSRKAAALLAEHGVDPALFRNAGLVTSREIVAHLNKGRAPAAPAPVAANRPAANGAAGGGSAEAPVRIEPLSRSKRAEIGHLSWATTATLPSLVAVPLPAGMRRAAERHPRVRGNLTAIVIFEAARLLRKYPMLNAFYGDGAANVYEEVNVGYAVDAGNGLKVMVVREADGKTLPAIMAEMQQQVVRYLNKDVHGEDLARGTFTITDLSGEGVTEFVPLINKNQAAILGIGGDPDAASDPAASYKLILAFDHQLAEGRMAAAFLNELRARLIGYRHALAAAAGELRPGGEGEPQCAECLRVLSEIEQMGGHLLQKVSADRSVQFICTRCSVGF